MEEPREQDVNAQSMPKPMFDRLQTTVGRDSRLEQLPFLAWVESEVNGERKGWLEIVSGHHRIRAARAAGLTEFYGLVDVTGLTRDQITAKQLAHNAIAGESDPELVARLFTSIGDVEARLEAFIDPAMLEIEVPKVSIDEIDMGIPYETVIISFIPFEREYFERTVEIVEKELRGTNADAAWLAEHKAYETWQTLAYRIIDEFDIRTMSTIMKRIAELALMQLGESTQRRPDEWVAIRDIVGNAYVPADVAEHLRSAMTIVQERGRVPAKEPWLALGVIAEAFVDGQSPEAP
jgi:hypothetical protein